MATDRRDGAVPAEVDLAPPAVRAGAVHRERLRHVLDEAVRTPLAVVVAPAGTGKTAGLTAWAGTADLRVLWLDARVRPDPGTVAAAWSQLVDPSPRPGSTAVLVVDDAHHLSPPSWDALRRVVDRIPHGVRVVLSSRDEPPLPLVALQLAGRLSHVRAGALRFDDDEAARLVRLHAPQADERAVAQVCAGAQGWAALLVLGASSLRTAPGVARSTAELVHGDRPTLDYLRDEVLSTLPAATRHVLLCTCDEAEVTDDLATVLSGDPDAPRRLHELAVATDGLVVSSAGPTRVPDQVSWRCHPLVQELLRRRVAADGPDHEAARAAHVAASRHFRRRGQWARALQHARADEATLVALLVLHGPEVLGAVSPGDAEAAVRSLTGEAPDRAPALLGVVAAERRMAGDWLAASRLADEAVVAARSLVPHASGDGVDQAAVAAVRALPDERVAQLTDAGALAAWQARLGLRAVGEALRSCRLVLAAFPTASAHEDEGPARSTWPLGPVRMACLLHELASLELWTGDLDGARARTADVLVTGQRLGAHRLRAGALANQALLDLMAGEFQTGAGHARACLALAASTGGPADAVEARALVVLAWSAYWAAELPAAAAALQEVGRRTSQVTDPLVVALADLLQACFDAEAGDVPGARSRLALSAAGPVSPPYLRWTTGLVRGQLALVAGDLADADAQLAAMEASGWPEGTANLRGVMEAVTGDAEAAVARLESVVERRVPGTSGSAAAVAAADLTRVLLTQGDHLRARETLWRALTLAAPQRVIMPLVVGGGPRPALAALLDEAASAPQPHPFAAQVRRALARYSGQGVEWRSLPPGPPPLVHLRQRRPQAPDAVAPAASERGQDGTPVDVVLTGRELEVLAELAAGGSYSDIAQALYITENTVKTHLSSAYRKLGVTSRPAALRAARERGLVPPRTAPP